jgi:hypothetical protein
MNEAWSPKGSATHHALTVAGVIALHGAAFWCLSQIPVAWRSVVSIRPAVTVFLLDNTDKPVRPVKPLEPPQHRAPVPASRAATGAAAVESAPSTRAGAITLEPGLALGGADAPSPAPLNLQLPKGWLPQSGLRHPALETQGGQGQPMTLENRLVKALGDGQWTEERLGDGRLRLRNGSQCLYLQRNRSDVLHPFNAPSTPWTAQAC